jgi:ankyrin repeat protein
MKGSTNGHVDVVRALLAAGADAGQQDDEGQTALSRAQDKDHAAVVVVATHRYRAARTGGLSKADMKTQPAAAASRSRRSASGSAPPCRLPPFTGGQTKNKKTRMNERGPPRTSDTAARPAGWVRST